MAAKTTWNDLVRECPYLSALEEGARCTADTKGKRAGWCANEYWYGRLKPLMMLLVGWTAMQELTDHHPVLGTRAAYEVAYDHLESIVPPCRHEGMCRR